MYNSFLIKYGEIGIKGDNRHLFEDALAKRIRTLLARIDGDFDVTKTRGRIYVNCGGNWNFDETIDVLQHVFGIVGICPVVIYEKGDIEKLRADIVSYIHIQGEGETCGQGISADIHGGGCGARRGDPHGLSVDEGRRP